MVGDIWSLTLSQPSDDLFTGTNFIGGTGDTQTVCLISEPMNPDFIDIVLLASCVAASSYTPTSPCFSAHRWNGVHAIFPTMACSQQ